MSDPGYDFFATGRPQPPPGSPVLPEPPAPPAPAGIESATYHAPAPRAEFRRPDGVVVNQFGTPIGTDSAPTGPYAAPGIGAAPTAVPGMVSTWDGPATAPAGSHRAEASRASSSSAPPRNVAAVAVLALFFGALGAFATVMGLLGYLQLSSQLDAISEASQLAGALLTAVLVALVILAAVTALLLVGGIATLLGRRWGGWMLVASYALYLLGQMQSFASGGLRPFDLVFVLIALALLLVLVTGQGLAWLLGRPR